MSLAIAMLMPAINKETDEVQKGRFKLPHGLSVVITLAHIVLTATALVPMV